MEPRGSRTRLLALTVVLAAVFATSSGQTGKGGRKIIIHVPYYVKNHHHTHTVFKYMKPKDESGDGESVGGGGDGDADGGASLEQGHRLHHGDGGGGASLEQGHRLHHGDADGGASLEQGHRLHHGGDGKGSGEREHHDDFFHSSQGEGFGHHDEGASQDAPQALGLHGEPRQVHGRQGQGHGDGRGEGRGHHGGGGDNRGDRVGDRGGPNRGYLHRQRSQQQQREEDTHVHREEKTRHHHRNNNNHHHHHGHHDQADEGHEHAHFHTKFTVGENDGQVHETDSSESSELSGHGLLEAHREPVPTIIPREQDYHNRYETPDHEPFERRPFSEERRPFTEERHPGDDFGEEGRHGNPPHHEGHNALHTEVRPDESQHYSFEKEPTYDRYRNEKFDDKFVPRENRGFRKHKGKRYEEKPKRQKYEVEEPSQESSPSREPFSSHENPDYEPIRRRKHNYDWR